MGYFYFLPKWFVVYGLGLEFVYTVITFLVAIYSYKIYRASLQRELKLFSLGFLSISLSYLSWFFLNLLAFFELRDVDANIIAINTANRLLNIGAHTHIFFFLFGMIILAYLTLKVKSSRTIILMFSLITLPMVLSEDRAILFYSISSVLLLFLVAHYLFEYSEKRNPKLALMLSAFVLLFIGTFELIFSTKAYVHYISGHIFIFLSYMLVLANLISVFNYGQKKNKARDNT